MSIYNALLQRVENLESEAMFCDICGMPIEGKPKIVIVDRAKLRVCDRCARRLASATRVAEEHGISLRVPEVPSTQLQRPITRRERVPRLAEEEYEIVEDFAERIKSAREAIGLSRKELAALVGEKESVLRRIEEGELEPTLDLARRIEKVLRIKLIVRRSEEEVEEEEVEFEEGEEEEGLTLGDIVEIRRKR